MAFDRWDRPRTTSTQDDPADFMGTLSEMTYVMQKKAAVVHHMMDQLGRQPEASHRGNLNGPEPRISQVRGIQKANPPSFRGTFDPDKAEEWVKAMEKIFFTLACIDR